MRQLNYKEIASFCQEIAWLVHSGVRVGDGLHLLAEEEKETAWKDCLISMAEQADEGLPLSEIVKNSGCFPVYVQGILNVGETTGRLEESLLAIKKYYEGREYMNNRVRSALLYPSILLLLMLVVIVVLLTQVLPIFQSVFASLGGKMGGLAGGLLTLGVVINKAMPFLCVLMAVVVAFVIAFSVSNGFREKMLGAWKKKAGDKGVMRKMNDASFAQAISMGLSSGLPLEETMELAAEVLNDIPQAKERCLNCKEELLSGIPLADALKKADVFPPAMCRLLSLGMQSGNGDAVMVEIADRLTEEADVALAARVEKVEPTLVLITSILVGIILLSVMLPLMNIMEAIG